MLLNNLLCVMQGGMMVAELENQNVLSIEFFAAKGSHDIFMAVPRHCGLEQADLLRVTGLEMVAVRGGSVLPVALPALDPAMRDALSALARSGMKLAVGEFRSRGLANSYFLDVAVG